MNEHRMADGKGNFWLIYDHDMGSMYIKDDIDTPVISWPNKELVGLTLKIASCDKLRS